MRGRFMVTLTSKHQSLVMSMSTSSSSTDDSLQRQVAREYEKHAGELLTCGVLTNVTALTEHPQNWQVQAETLWSQLSAALYDDPETADITNCAPVNVCSPTENRTRTLCNAKEEHWGTFRLWSEETLQSRRAELPERLDERLREARCAAVLDSMGPDRKCHSKGFSCLAGTQSACAPRADVEIDTQGSVIRSFADTLPTRFRDTHRCPQRR
jgi:hypothetical protein